MNDLLLISCIPGSLSNGIFLLKSEIFFQPLSKYVISNVENKAIRVSRKEILDENANERKELITINYIESSRV